MLSLLVGETDFWSEAHAAFGGVQALPTETSAATMENVVAHLEQTTGRAAGGPGLGGASVGRGRGVEAVASTSMAENITVTVLFTVTVLTVFSSSVHTYLYA